MRKTVILIIIILSIVSNSPATPPQPITSGIITLTGSTNLNKFILYNQLDPNSVKTQSKFENEYNRLLLKHQLSIRTQHFSSDNNQIQNDFCELLDYKNYPFIFIGIKQELALNSQSEFTKNRLVVEITIAGIKRSYLVLSELDKLDTDNYLLKGKQSISLSDFGLKAPTKFFGLVKVDELVEVDFSFSVNLTQLCNYEIQYKDTLRIKGDDRNLKIH